MLLYQIRSTAYQASYDGIKGDWQSGGKHGSLSDQKRYQKTVGTKCVMLELRHRRCGGAAEQCGRGRTAKAAVETARINLAYTKVTSPISGRIGKSP